MASKRPSVGLRRLMRTGVLDTILPELCALTDREKCGRNTHKNIFAHTLKVLNNVAAVTDDLTIRWAALLHDIAKPAVRAYDDVRGWTFERHEIVGADMARDILTRLGLTEDVSVRKVCKLVRLHMKPIDLDGATDKAVTRFRAEAWDVLPELMILARADVTTKDARMAADIAERYDRLEARINALSKEECRPELTDAVYHAVFDNGVTVNRCTATDLNELRNRYGAFEKASCKHKGAGRGIKVNYKWVWNDYAAFIADLKQVLPTEYAHIRMSYMRDMFMAAGGDKSEYRNAIKAVRHAYGLSKKAVEDYMRV